MEIISDRIIAHNVDCMEYMRGVPDGFYDLAIVDPPYGIGEDGLKNHTRGKLAKPNKYKSYTGNDSEPPSEEYFEELFRVSKNQIIWGANHFISRIPVEYCRSGGLLAQKPIKSTHVEQRQNVH